LILALHPREELAQEAGLTARQPAFSTASISIGHNVAAKKNVDWVIAHEAAAGARIVDPGHDQVWGRYSGYFHDPDGHLWEIVWNPDLASLLSPCYDETSRRRGAV
jgi:predicted lactoylglutathione lyase